MIKFLRSKLIKSVKSRQINIFFLFFLLSFMFLLLTKLTKDYTKTITFQIKPINSAENFVILKDTSHKLNITLRTYGFKFLRYYLSNPEVTVDLKDLNSKGNEYFWTNKIGLAHINSQFGESVEIMAVSPDSLIFRFDRNAVKKIPVVLKSDIIFAPGFNISENLTLLPDSIKLIGPKILLDTITRLETQVLNLKDVKSDIDTPLNLILPDSSLNFVYSHKEIRVKGDVEKFTEGIVDVPVDVINIPSNLKINFFPKTIGVSYYTSLSNFEEVNKNDFIIECDFKNIVEGRTYLEATLVKFPPKVKNLKLNQKRIEFIISE